MLPLFKLRTFVCFFSSLLLHLLLNKNIRQAFLFVLFLLLRFMSLCMFFSINFYFAFLIFIGMVDSKVRVSNQLAQLEDTIRVKNTLENNRINHYNSASEVLSQRVKILHSEHTQAEQSREELQSETLSRISTLEIEEKDLAERLKRVKEEIANAKKSFIDEQESCKLLRLSEKARISYATKESNKCSQMLFSAQANKELLDKFKSYITNLTNTNGNMYDNDTNYNQKNKYAKLNDGNEKMPSSKKKSKGVVKNDDSLNLISKISSWIEQTQLTRLQTQTESNTKNMPNSTKNQKLLLFSRLIYEGMRLSRQLLLKYSPLNMVGNSTHNYKQQSKGVMSDNNSNDALEEFERLFRSHDLYEEREKPSKVVLLIGLLVGDMNVLS